MRDCAAIFLVRFAFPRVPAGRAIEHAHSSMLAILGLAYALTPGTALGSVRFQRPLTNLRSFGDARVVRPSPEHHQCPSAAPSRLGQPRLSAGDENEEWRAPALLSLENAGPFAIIFVVFACFGLATLPRETLPPILQQLIPLVLGKQFAVPPPGV